MEENKEYIYLGQIAEFNKNNQTDETKRRNSQRCPKNSFQTWAFTKENVDKIVKTCNAMANDTRLKMILDLKIRKLDLKIRKEACR